MIVAHLIGGNEIKGFTNGIVIINDEKLEASYQDLVEVCGNISLGDLDTSITIRRNEKDVEHDYIRLVNEFDDKISEAFVVNNYLTKQICYSSYEIDVENKTLVLKIDTY